MNVGETEALWVPWQTQPRPCAPSSPLLKLPCTPASLEQEAWVWSDKIIGLTQPPVTRARGLVASKIVPAGGLGWRTGSSGQAGFCWVLLSVGCGKRPHLCLMGRCGLFGAPRSLGHTPTSGGLQTQALCTGDPHPGYP